MADSLADRLKRMAAQNDLGPAAEAELISRQDRVNQFISENARPEYDRLQIHLRKRIEEINPELGPLPKFEINVGSGTIQQSNYMAFFHFDKPISNMPNNQLMLSFGPHPHAQYAFTEPPQALRYRLQAAASDAVDSIVWVGDLGELTTSQLSDLILETLTDYYLENKP